MDLQNNNYNNLIVEIGTIISNSKQKVITSINTFLLELGKGFSFVGRQERFSAL